MSATPTGAAADGGLMAMAVNFAPFIVILVLFYFMLIRPQQKRAKQHQAMVEISQGVNVRVVKAMVAEVRNRGAIAANNG